MPVTGTIDVALEVSSTLDIAQVVSDIVNAGSSN
jgi:hypothetical protein